MFGLVVVSALAVLGTVTFLNNTHNRANRAFMGICFSLALWIIANYFADATLSLSLLWSRLAFIAITAGMYFFVRFARNFPRVRTGKISVAFRAFQCMVVVLVVVEMTGLFIPSTFVQEGTSNVVTGSLYFLFPLYLVATLGYSLSLLTRNMFRARGADRTRIGFVLSGIVLTAAFGSVTNLILPSINGTNDLATVGTFSTVIFASLTTYAIIKHHLFDIRAYAARAFTYLLTLLSLFALYVGIISAISQTALGDTTARVDSLASRVLFISLALVSALIFQPIKHFFDHVSNKLFYRDSYDSQVLLDELNDILVGTLDISALLHGTANLAATTIKASFVAFAVTANHQRFVIKSSAGDIEEGEKLLSLLEKSSHKTVAVSDNSRVPATLLEAMHASAVAVSVRMATHDQHIGFMLVGLRQSGANYSSQDIKVMEIIADELAIASQNALRFEEIKQFNVTLQEKIDNATKKLRHTNQKLRDLDETKDEFISMASHQLRTPLTAVKGYVSMVLEGDMGKVDPKQKELLEQAFISAQRMVYLIADLLNVSRLKTGKFIIQRRPTQLADVIESELTQLVTTAKGRNLELAYDKPKGFPMLMLDETKIRQVIMNFADNAIYYTPPGGHIKLGLVNKESSVEFTVSDDGIGVPKAQQHNLFTKFYRAGNAQKARPDGTGLGLFMAKKVVVSQGGAIIFHSEEGKGSTFGFSFPKTKELTDVKDVPSGSFSPLQ